MAAYATMPRSHFKQKKKNFRGARNSTDHKPAGASNSLLTGMDYLSCRNVTWKMDFRRHAFFLRLLAGRRPAVHLIRRKKVKKIEKIEKVVSTFTTIFRLVK